MKKFITLVVLITGVIFSTQAQKKKKDHKEKFTVAQQTELAVKKMTLQLDLSQDQQAKIKPILAEKYAFKKQLHEQRKKARENNEKPSLNEQFDTKNKMLDQKIAFKKEMKRILNNQQYERFEKMQARKEHGKKKRMKKGKHKKHQRVQHDAPDQE